MKTTIIFVPGIKTDDKYLSFWNNYLIKTFPEADVIFIKGRYHYNESDKLLQKKDELIKIITNSGVENKIIVVSHSYGAIIAKSAIDTFENHSRITYISMAGPHGPALTDITESKAVLGYVYNTPQYRSYTYGGYLDTTVKAEASRLPEVEHKNLLAGHVWFIAPQIPTLYPIKKELLNLVSN